MLTFWCRGNVSLLCVSPLTCSLSSKSSSLWPCSSSSLFRLSGYIKVPENEAMIMKSDFSASGRFCRTHFLSFSCPPHPTLLSFDKRLKYVKGHGGWLACLCHGDLFHWNVHIRKVGVIMGRWNEHWILQHVVKMNNVKEERPDHSWGPEVPKCAFQSPGHSQDHCCGKEQPWNI